MSEVKKPDNLNEKYEEQYDDLKKTKRKKYTMSKFKKKLQKWGKRFNKQSDYRKRAKRK